MIWIEKLKSFVWWAFPTLESVCKQKIKLHIYWGFGACGLGGLGTNTSLNPYFPCTDAIYRVCTP